VPTSYKINLLIGTKDRKGGEKMAKKLKELCSSLATAKDDYTVCDSCGRIYLKSRNTCPKCGSTGSKEVQAGDMDREVER
jgi:uncharacterized OB-fold protein